MHKIIDDKPPSYLKDKLPPYRHPFLKTVFREIKFNNDRYKKSFFPDAISSWNGIITNFEYFPTRDTLKEHLLFVRNLNQFLVYMIPKVFDIFFN